MEKVKKNYKTFKAESDHVNHVHRLIGMESEGKSINVLLKKIRSNWFMTNKHFMYLLLSASVEEKTESITSDMVNGKLDALEHAEQFDAIYDSELKRLEKLFTEFEIKQMEWK